MTTKEWDEQKVDNGKVKTKEDIDVKLKSLPNIDFIIPSESTNMGRKKYYLILLLTKMIEALVQVSNWKVHIFQHFKTWEWVFFQLVENDETMDDWFVTTSQIWSFKIYFMRSTWEVQLKWKG